MFGGSVNNTFCKYLERKNTYLVAGFNLSLILDLLFKEDINEKIVDNFGSLIGSLVGTINLLILTVVGIIWFIFAPIWIPLYICVRIVRRSYYRIHNIRFYNKCGSPFKMFENILSSQRNIYRCFTMLKKSLFCLFQLIFKIKESILFEISLW